MEMKIWAKTFLESYKCLETISNAIDKLVKKQSLSLGFNNRGNTFEELSKLDNLTNRKVNLINIKVLVENGLASLKTSDTRILTLYYLDEFKSKEIALRLGISERTFFRKKNVAIEKFANYILMQGFNKERIANMVKNEQWLNYAYKENLNKEYDNYNKQSKFRILNFALREIKFNKKFAL